MSREGNAVALARKQNGLISREQAVERGFSKDMILRRLAAREWRRYFVNVFVVGAAVDGWLMRAQAALLWAGPDSALCRRSAAFIHGWHLNPPKTVEIVIPHGRTLASPAKDVVVYRSRNLCEDHVRPVNGMRTTRAPWTLIDLAAERDVEAILDCAIHVRANNLAWTRDRLDEGDGFRREGIDKLRRLIAERTPEDSQADSRLEARFRQMLKKAGIPAAHHEMIHDADDEFLLESDFCWASKRVVAEVDGPVHERHAAMARRADVTQRLAAIDWLLIPVTKEDVNHRSHEVIRRIKQTLDKRG